MRLGGVIKAWRERNFMGVREAARLMKLSSATLSRVENGKPADGATIIKIWDWLIHDES